MKNHFLKVFSVIGLFLFVIPRPAHAYLDPGTGSYVLQMIAAAFFGGLYFITTGWKNIKTFFVRLVSRKEKKKTEKHAGEEE